jgi:hypothetical protein
MGNHSSVIVTFSGIDNLACREDYGESRGQEILRAISFMRGDLVGPGFGRVHTSCGPTSIGMACEVVVVTSANHFQPRALLEALAKMEWQYPWEVEVFSKNEEADNYKIARLQDPPEER